MYTKVFGKLIIAIMSTSMLSEKPTMNMLKCMRVRYFVRPCLMRLRFTMTIKYPLSAASTRRYMPFSTRSHHSLIHM